jgi:hypothetical protein
MFTLLVATLVAISTAAVDDRPGRDRWRAGVRTFAWCIAAVVGGGWAMLLIHG